MARCSMGYRCSDPVDQSVREQFIIITFNDKNIKKQTRFVNLSSQSILIRAEVAGAG